LPLICVAPQPFLHFAEASTQSGGVMATRRHAEPQRRRVSRVVSNGSISNGINDDDVIGTIVTVDSPVTVSVGVDVSVSVR
jgi:hypothetical protein